MIKKNLEDIKRHKDIVESYLRGFPPYKICEHFNITHNELLALIDYYGLPYEKDILPVSTIRDKRAIFIADTHIGSEDERIDLINETYDFAKREEINHVVHLGDALQAGDIPVIQEYQEPDRQIEHFDESYPSRSGVMTHILFGNHDLKILDKNHRYMKVISSRPDMDVLGFKIAYLQWGRHLLSLYHECNHYHLNIPKRRTDLILEGHKHAFSSKGKIIKVPSLSDDMKYYDGSISEPGFLVGEQTKNKIRFDFMSFDGGNMHCHSRVYEKHFKQK